MTTARSVVTGVGWPELVGPSTSAPIGWLSGPSGGIAESEPALDSPEATTSPDPCDDAPATTRPPAPTPTALSENPGPGVSSDDAQEDESLPEGSSAPERVPELPRPPAPRIMTVSNQKGGVGKTTSAVNLAAALAERGLEVLLIDTDPQGNASTALNIEHHAEVPSVYDVLVDGASILDVMQACPDVDNLWCVPATIDLAGAEIELVSLVARESRMARAVSALHGDLEAAGRRRLDYVIIDCPPSLGLLTVNAFVAAAEVLIPIQCEYYALEGLSQLLNNITLIQTHLNPQLHVSTILLTMYDGRTRLSSQVAEEVRSHFPDEVLKATVPRSVRVSEAPSFGQTVITYDPQSTGARCYQEAAAEIAHRGAATKDGS
ncbi:ParA family protein [Janibacter sp. GS2]|uniref:ParA family protein n=1 Tax=Janibacter sp. GS2 TaxID=3442646 RepID=UPI003EBAAC56